MSQATSNRMEIITDRKIEPFSKNSDVTLRSCSIFELESVKNPNTKNRRCKTRADSKTQTSLVFQIVG